MEARLKLAQAIIVFCVGTMFGNIITLIRHDTAIKEHKFKQYKLSHTNNITIEEWSELKN